MEEINIAFKMKKITICLLFGWALSSYSQQPTFTKQDTLRGSITPERSWWDLNFYNLSVEVKPDEKFISGSNNSLYGFGRTAAAASRPSTASNY